jgi:hypothetical protein
MWAIEANHTSTCKQTSQVTLLQRAGRNIPTASIRRQAPISRSSKASASAPISGGISTYRQCPDFRAGLLCNQNITDTLCLGLQSGGDAVNGIIYLVGLVVIVLFILSFFGLR